MKYVKPKQSPPASFLQELFKRSGPEILWASSPTIKKGLSMNWKSSLAKRCLPLNIEPTVEDTKNKVTFYCPIEPKGVDKANLLRILPMTWAYDFQISPKPQTILDLRKFLEREEGFNLTSSILDNPKIHLPETVEPRTLRDINNLLASDGYYQYWSIFIGDNETPYFLKDEQIRLKMDKEVKRDTPINQDDILNLTIMLETMDVNEFINSL